MCSPCPTPQSSPLRLGLEDDDDDDLIHLDDDQGGDNDDLTERKADIHLCGKSFVGSIQLAGVPAKYRNHKRYSMKIE